MVVLKTVPKRFSVSGNCFPILVPARTLEASSLNDFPVVSAKSMVSSAASKSSGLGGQGIIIKSEIKLPLKRVSSTQVEYQ
jgi:hypothetical protein